MIITEETPTRPLLNEVVCGFDDFHGHPAHRGRSGCWKSASFIIGVEVAERFAYYGISSNLISYLTGPLGESTAAAAAAVNAWSGVGYLLPLLGAFVADSFLGQYRTIIIASLVHILGLGFLSLSAAFQSSSSSSPPPSFQVIFFFFSLYLLALAQGGHKPCVQAFGADQFDEEGEDELVAKSSFFNWWYFSMNGGTFVAQLVLSYIQDNLSWELGFGIPCIMMIAALLVFLLGSLTYRFRSSTDQKNPFLRIASSFVVTWSNRENAEQNIDAKEAKEFLRIVPIWASSLAYAVVYAQSTTLFTKQGATMDRSFFYGLQIPAASMRCLMGLSVMAFIPIYDLVLVPIVRASTRRSTGITTLQRIGIGIFLSIVFIAVAALVERRRISVAIEHGLVDQPNVTVPMSVWWLAPQYVLLEVSEAFTMVGLQEFMYDQVSGDLKSLGLALYLSVFGVGMFVSSFLITVVESATSRGGGGGWLVDNLNRGHLDYFYWLLVGITAISLVAYVYFAKSYVYKAKHEASEVDQRKS